MTANYSNVNGASRPINGRDIFLFAIFVPFGPVSRDKQIKEKDNVKKESKFRHRLV
jgi:hypothetical protein